MTVAQLIRRLQKMPQDKIVTIHNDEMYISGDYEITEVTEYSTVDIGTNYRKKMGIEQ